MPTAHAASTPVIGRGALLLRRRRRRLSSALPTPPRHAADTIRSARWKSPCRFTPIAASQDLSRLPLLSTRQAKQPGLAAVSAATTSESSELESESDSAAALRAVRLAAVSLLLPLLLVPTSVSSSDSESLSSELLRPEHAAAILLMPEPPVSRFCRCCRR